jgi:quinol monooxygenase YgiN
MANDPPEPVVVLMRFDASDEAGLAAVLSRYVVTSRGDPGCRNIDWCRSATAPGRFVIIQKWASLDDQRRHFDSPTMVEMAEGCRGRLVGPPDIDLLDPVSAHDLA